MEIFSALLALCSGNSPVTGEFPMQRPVMRSFDASFHLRLNKRLSKQSWGWWFETRSRQLWRHRNDCMKLYYTVVKVQLVAQHKWINGKYFLHPVQPPGIIFYIRSGTRMYCGVVILFSRGEFGHERNKIYYQGGCVWIVYYMTNLWYNTVILQHIFILRNTWCERSYFVFNLRSFERTRDCDSQVFVFGVFSGNIC